MYTKKHAYLIIAHNNFSLLEKLIILLDDKRNDIYIHIDRKVARFDPKRFQDIAKKSGLFFVPRINVSWGGYSLIKCELELLSAAINSSNSYEYYHLISGVDLPLKTQDYIHDFFDKNSGLEFIHFDKKNYDSKHNTRVQFYYFLQEYLQVPKTSIGKRIIKLINKFLVYMQKCFGVKRLKNQNIEFQKGAQWFSITDSLARYIMSNEAWIKKTFEYSHCGDEMFIQTLVWNSEYKSKLFYKEFDNNYISCLRKIDWIRGNPYIWREKDFDELVNSQYLFARKFDSSVEQNIIEKISDYLLKNDQQ